MHRVNLPDFELSPLNSGHRTPSRRSAPRVSRGMPAYNGERYLEGALRSLLGQAYGDCDLVISDNVSTDRTSSICHDYASMDRRIRYLRNDVNVRFCRNQNRVLELATGKYFLLTHHDDIHHSDYLARTVEVMEADESIIVCYTKTRDIDENGNSLSRQGPPLQLDTNDPRERSHDIIRMDHKCEAIFGVTRMDKLRKTPLHSRFHCVDEYLFFCRHHASQLTAIAPDRYSRTVWFDPGKKGKLVFPHFHQFREYLAAIQRAPIDWRQRTLCLGERFRWAVMNRRRMLCDLEFGLKQTVRPVYRAVVSKKRKVP
jgi:glycosyltransferase involved in cell wall biosynthesis